MIPHPVEYYTPVEQVNGSAYIHLFIYGTIHAISTTETIQHQMSGFAERSIYQLSIIQRNILCGSTLGFD